MIKARIKIGDGQIYDTYEKWGFIYLSSDNRTSAPEKALDEVSYAGANGKSVDPRVVLDAFDYKVTFLIQTPNDDLQNANVKIKAFNDDIRTSIAGSNTIKKCKTITLYNDHKRVKIVGIPDLIAEPTEFYRCKGVDDCVKIELVVHVYEPDKCSFSMATDTHIDVDFDNLTEEQDAQVFGICNGAYDMSDDFSADFSN